MNARPDPRRPWKAIIAALVAGIATAVAQGQDVLPAWLLLVLSVAGAGLCTFLVPNPTRDEPPEH
jgi:hypothetical protein